MRRNRESKPGIHSARVALDGRVDEVLDFGELDYFVELASDFDSFHPHYRALKKNVLAAGQVGVESGSDLDQHPHATVNLTDSTIRAKDFGEEFEDCRLAGAVRANDPECVAHSDVE